MAGVNFTNLYGWALWDEDNWASNSIRVGYNAGGYTNYRLHSRVTTRLELRINNRGVKAKYIDMDDVVTEKWTLSQTYLEPAIFIKYNVWHKLQAGCGFSMGYLSNTTFKEKIGSVPEHVRNLTYTRFDKNWNLEISYEIAKNAGVYFRFAKSIVSIYLPGKEIFWFEYNYDNKNNSLFYEALETGFNFTLNKNNK